MKQEQRCVTAQANTQGSVSWLSTSDKTGKAFLNFRSNNNPSHHCCHYSLVIVSVIKSPIVSCLSNVIYQVGSTPV